MKLAVHHKAFLAIAGGVFVGLVADSFISSAIAPILSQLKIQYA